MTPQLTWQADDVIRAVHGHYLHEQTWTARGVSIDSLMVRPGDLFVALKGPDHDGHDDVAVAFAAGAVAAIVSRPPQVSAQAPLITVADTFKALGDLGRAGRQRSQARIVAITGSTATTGSKEMLRLMLNEVGDTYTNENMLNNRRNVSLSLTHLPEAALYGIFDIGANHAGEHGSLSQPISPDVALITTIEAIHLGYFASMEEVADAKAEIFLGMKPEGVAVLNRDNPQFARLTAAARTQGLKKILGFGRDTKADARLLEYTETPDGGVIKADILGRKIHYSLGVPGMRAALNSLGALCTAVAAGGDLNACAAALAHVRQSRDRSVIQTVALPDGAFTLIDESADDNPVALPFAIRVLGQMTPDAGGQRILVLGDNAPVMPADIAHDIIEAKIASVFTCGPAMEHLYGALPPAIRGFHAQDSSELAPRVAKAVYPGDVVIVKGGPDADMEIIVDALKALGDDSRKAKKLAG